MKVRLPEFGDGSAYGTIIAWCVEEGELVEKGQLLLEVETDKAILKIDTPASGVLRAVYKEEGSVVGPNEELGEIEKRGEN
ncbi:MAG: hypothetical protein KJ995_04645 [Candidatus Omnitrophica bacterium]|nr:hypothetical protein [Candidatus Omnitrophota bacterium]MBU1128211.1 hypothetical protein [Candidatus Omnitrophota bacterium]MBU1784561.1 hypothetical protein [Candidatus Omnitrophota bacterium]MBU1851674.1 hypothetical protein [Candidatus Omnitrophota bacterium]